MSVLINKLKNVARGQINSIGFAASSASASVPSMLLIARMDTVEKIEFSDAALIKLTELDTGTLNKLSKITALPWGIEINQLSKEKAGQAISKGCDFILFGNDSKTEFLISDTTLGKVLFIDHSLPTSILVAVNNLPVEAVLVRLNHNLTIKDIMICNQINNLIAKPIIVDLPTSLQDGDLEALYKAGVSGLIVDWKQGSSSVFKDLRNRISNLPKRKALHDKFIASVPQIKQTDVPEQDNEEDFE